MHLAAIDSIVVDAARQRQIFDSDKIQELADSIALRGLLHPLVVRDVEDGAKYELVAGERRLKAIQLLHSAGRSFKAIHMQTFVPPGFAPVALAGSLEPIEAKEIELDENIRRVDLSWQERAKAVRDLHELRQSLNPAQTLQQTADELTTRTGLNHQSTVGVGNRITLANHLHIPEVASAPNEKEALRALRRNLENTLHAALGKKTPQVQHDRYTLLQGDARLVIDTLPNAEFDVVLTDPPYGIGADNFGGISGTAIEHLYEDSLTYFTDLITAVVPQLTRVTRPRAHLYMFCDVRYFSIIEAELILAGWDVWPRPFVWHKNVGHTPRPNLGPHRLYETILYANKGDMQVVRARGDVLQYPIVQDKLHPAQKPVELYIDLLERSLQYPEQMKVLDPFCGSGTIFPAVHALNSSATGIEMSDASYGKAKERIVKECK